MPLHCRQIPPGPFSSTVKTRECPEAHALNDDLMGLILCSMLYRVSRVMADAFNNVTAHNSSAAGGELPSNIRFARLNYGSETVLTTRWWMWK